MTEGKPNVGSVSPGPAAAAERPAAPVARSAIARLTSALAGFTATSSFHVVPPRGALVPGTPRPDGGRAVPRDRMRAPVVPGENSGPELVIRPNYRVTITRLRFGWAVLVSYHGRAMFGTWRPTDRGADRVVRRWLAREHRRLFGDVRGDRGSSQTRWFVINVNGVTEGNDA